MKAIIQPALHQPAHYTDVEKPVAGPGEVVVKLKAAALNHRDVFIQKGMYPGIKLPVIPGADGAGIVVETGEGVDPIWRNQAVVVNPSLNWGPNPHAFGPNFAILGMPDNGTFAEYLKIGATYLHHKPAHLSFEQAAAIPLAGLTAWRVLMTRAGFKPTDKVLITGIGGGVALFVLQFAVSAGAEVWVTSGSEEKLQRAISMGAKGGVNYRNSDWLATLMTQTGGGRAGYFDVIIDSAGGPDFNKLIDAAAPGGRIAFYGGTTGNIPELTPGRVFFKQLNIYGSMMGTEKEFSEMVRFVAENELLPIVDEIFPLADAERALRRMDEGKQFGKIVLKIEE